MHFQAVGIVGTAGSLAVPSQVDEALKPGTTDKTCNLKGPLANFITNKQWIGLKLCAAIAGLFLSLLPRALLQAMFCSFLLWG